MIKSDEVRKKLVAKFATTATEAKLQAKKKELDKPRNPIGFHAIEERRRNQG